MLRRNHPSYARQKSGLGWFRQKYVLPLSLGTAVLAFIGFQGWYLFYRSSYFALESVQVSGQQQISREDVVKLSGLKRGDLIFQLDVTQIQERMMKADSRIEHVRLLQISPREIQIQISERKPSIYVRNGNEYIALTDDGVILPLSEDTQKPKISVSLSAYEKESRKINPETMQAIQQWTSLLENSPLARYESISFETRGRISIRWDGVTFYVLEVESFYKHEEKILPILKKVADEGLRLDYVDVRFDNMVIKLA